MERKNRHNNRLKYYDYSRSGLYFITICCDQMQYLFGQVVDGEMRLSPFGEIASNAWKDSAIIRENILLHEFVIMPNHMHSIVEISNPSKIDNAAIDSTSRKTSLGDIIKGFKSSTTKKIRQDTDDNFFKVWQRNYHEHIIRDEKSLMSIKEYIQNNPLQWSLDRYYQAN